jgi:hypothetical protein
MRRGNRDQQLVGGSIGFSTSIPSFGRADRQERRR